MIVVGYMYFLVGICPVIVGELAKLPVDMVSIPRYAALSPSWSHKTFTAHDFHHTRAWVQSVHRPNAILVDERDQQ